MYEELNEWRLVHCCFRLQQLHGIPLLKEVLDDNEDVPKRIEDRIGLLYEAFDNL
jgi:hypothetical protein